MSVKAMTKGEGRAPRRRPSLAAAPGSASIAAMIVPADELTDVQLRTLLDERLTDLAHRVQAGLARTERLLKRLA